MKIRKGLLAAATAATVSVSGVVAAPAFAEETDTTTTTANPTTTSTPAAPTTTGTPTEEEGSSEGWDKFKEDFKAGSSDKEGNWDPKQIVAWIGVFTAIIGALGTVFSFVEKYIK